MTYMYVLCCMYICTNASKIFSVLYLLHLLSYVHSGDVQPNHAHSDLGVVGLCVLEYLYLIRAVEGSSVNFPCGWDLPSTFHVVGISRQLSMWSVNNAPYSYVAIAGQSCAKLEKSHVLCTHVYGCLWVGVDEYIHVY